MKALLNHADFTKMVDVPYPREVYEVCVQPNRHMTRDYMKYSTWQPWEAARVKYWIFSLVSVEKIDGEEVAIYEFMDER